MKITLKRCITFLLCNAVILGIVPGIVSAETGAYSSSSSFFDKSGTPNSFWSSSFSYEAKTDADSLLSSPEETVIYEESEEAVTLKLPPDAEQYPLQFTATYINPLYADVITEDDLVQPSGIALAAEVEYHTTVAPAGSAVREQLVSRMQTVTVGYCMSSWSNEDFSIACYNIFEEAVKHTGNPREGDFIRWQYGGWSASGSAYKTENTYYATITFTLTYYTTAEQEDVMDSAVEELKAELNLDGCSDYKIVKSVYDWLCANISYDYDETHVPIRHTAYAGLINRTCVCQGYAVLMYRMMLECEIDCRVIVGLGGTPGDNGNHAWNIVELNNVYYNLDATWDAGMNPESYGWFLLNEESFSNHERDVCYDEDRELFAYGYYNTEAFHAEYPMAEENYNPDTDNILASGQCGDNVWWTLDNDGVLTISGEGAMWDYYDTADHPWCNSYDSYNIRSVVIEDGVTYIGASSFAECPTLASVDMADSVTVIGEAAFKGCSALSSMSLSQNLEEISGGVFVYCTSLEEITLPDSLTTIGMNAFGGCHALREIYIPASTTMIDAGTFIETPSLESIVVDADNPVYFTEDSVLFQWFDENTAGLHTYPITKEDSEYIIPSAVVSVAPWAFWGNPYLTHVVIPASVVQIGGYAFEGCASLSDISFLGDAPVFGDDEFGSDVFYGITATAYYPANTPTWTDDVLQNYGGNITWVAQLPTSGQCGNNVWWTLDNDGVLTISGEGAMWDNPDILTDEQIPLATRLEIEDGITRIGRWAFYNYTSLTGDLILPESVEHIANMAFCNCSGFNGTLYLPDPITVIEAGAFNNCSGFTGELKLPASLTTLMDNAFNSCSGFTGSLTIPDSVTAIASSVFENCSGFNGELKLSDTTVTIAHSSFKNCSGFTGSLTIPDSVTVINEYAFSGCSGFTGSLTIPDSVTIINDYAFSECSGFNGSLTLSNSLEKIGESAFKNCSGFTGSLTIPASVETVDMCAFDNCTGFTGELIISAAAIEHAAFADCSGFRSILFTDTVASLGPNTFLYCNSVETIRFKGTTLPVISTSTVFNTSSLKTVYVPSKSYDAYMELLTARSIPSELIQMYALQISVSDLVIEAGGEATMELYVVGNPEPGVCGFILEVEYDADYLTPVKAESAQFPLTFTRPSLNGNPFRLVWDGMHGTTATGKLVSITFHASDVPAYVSSSDIVRITAGDCFDGTLEDMDCVVEECNVEINVSPVSLYDVNGDGELTEADALCLLRHTILPDRYPLAVDSADFDGDGSVTAGDAVSLLNSIGNITAP